MSIMAPGKQAAAPTPYLPPVQLWFLGGFICLSPFFPYPRKLPRGRMSTMPNIWKCISAPWTTRTGSGVNTANGVDWIKPYTKVKNTSYDYHNVSIKWFEDGTLNVSANCIDRHLEKRGKTSRRSSGRVTTRANPRHITYKELHART